jgi:hypothetical protein
LKKGFQPRLDICKDKNENVLGDKSQIMKRQVEYFEETLNRTDEQETEKIQYITADIEIESPSLLEVKMAIDKQKKNNRAPGEDFRVAELFKNGGQSLSEALHKIIVSVWEKEVMPKEWNIGLICPIFKKRR